jgi:hypothetical protein
LTVTCRNRPAGFLEPKPDGESNMPTIKHLHAVLAIACATTLAPPVSATAIDVPAGHALEHSLQARGVQIYRCQAGASGTFTWTFQAPLAELFHTEGGPVVARHYAGPTWESAEDGSRVQASRVASEPSASEGAIPQLLLAASVTAQGRTFGSVKFIQRVDTIGGSAPASGCDAGNQGAELRVDYTATYRFFKAN